MAYKDDFTKRAGSYNVGKKILDEEVVLSRYLDCTVDALSANGVYKLWAVPAGFQINDAYVTVVTGEGSAQNIEIDDDDTPTTRIVSACDVSAVGVKVITNRKYYSADGFICIKPLAAMSNTKMYVTIKGVHLNTKL